MVVAWRTNHIILAHICCAKVIQITARPGAIVPASVREPVSHTTPTWGPRSRCAAHKQPCVASRQSSSGRVECMG